MIVRLKAGGQIVLTECLWAPGAYLSAGNMRGSQGVILKPGEIDTLIGELTRIRAGIAERAKPKQQRKVA